MLTAINRSPLRFVLLFLLSVRTLLFFAPSFAIDMTAWQAWAARLAEVGPQHFYSPTIWTNYTPGYLLILWILGIAYRIFGITTFSLGFVIVIKIISTFFDLATAWLILKIIKEHSGIKWAILATFLYLGNTASIFNSSVWGQIDGILAFFMLYAVYTLLQTSTPTQSLVTYFYSLLIKPQSIAIAPLYMIIFLKKHSLRNAISGIFICSIFYLLIGVLFFPQNIFLGFPTLILTMSKDYSYTSLYAFNLWSLVGFWQVDTPQVLGLSYQLWGTIFYLVALFLILAPVILRPLDKLNTNIYLAATLLCMSFYLFPTRVHDRYLFPAFAFFLISACLRKSVLLLVSYIALVLIHTANLWYVYYYYTVIYNNPTPPPNIFYILTDHTYKIFAILTVAIFGLLYWYYLRTFAHVRKD